MERVFWPVWGMGTSRSSGVRIDSGRGRAGRFRVYTRRRKTLWPVSGQRWSSAYTGFNVSCGKWSRRESRTLAIFVRRSSHARRHGRSQATARATFLHHGTSGSASFARATPPVMKGLLGGDCLPLGGSRGQQRLSR